MTSMRRVVVTGMGIISCIGNDLNTVTESLMKALPQVPPEVQVQRTLDMAFCTHNIGAVPDFSKKSRIMDFVRKLQLLAGRYKARKLHLVGIQEARSRTGGQHQVRDFLRIVPRTDGPAQGDVELWIDTVLPWDPEDRETKYLFTMMCRLFCDGTKVHVCKHQKQLAGI